MLLGILSLFGLCVKCFNFRHEGETGVDLIEIEFLGVNKKLVKKMIFFKKRVP